MVNIGDYATTYAPAEYRSLANTSELENTNLSSTHHAVPAGEPLNALVTERWRNLHGITIYDGYGQVENTLLVGNSPALEVWPGSIGKPSPGCEVRILDPEGNECPLGETGIPHSRVTSPRSLRSIGSNPTRPRPSLSTATTLPGTGQAGTKTATSGSWAARTA